MARFGFAQAPPRWMPGHRVGRYELLSSIAEGGMASVWVARLRGEHGFEKLVAIKTILSQYAADPRYEHMFLDEARLIANIRHHNVAEILDLGSDHALPYLVLEWIEGDSLSLLQRAASENKRPIPVPSALHIAARMCAGLHAAHELRDRTGKRLDVVHRDVSPQNVLLSVTGEVKLIDFGIAKALDQLSADTHSGVLKGKISFMSPEQANGERLDLRTDIWALGVVLYQLLSGELPFRSESQQKTLYAIRSGRRPAPIAGLPPLLQKLLDRVLEPNREQRIANAAELESELERVSAHWGVATTRDIAALVTEHLGPRIAARRAAIEDALHAANHRARLVKAVDDALDQTRRPDDSATAVIGPFRSSRDDNTVAFDGTTPRMLPSLSLLAQLEPSLAALKEPAAAVKARTSEPPTAPDIAVAHSVAAEPSDLPPRRAYAGSFAVFGVLAAAIALLTVGLRGNVPPSPSAQSAVPAVTHTAAAAPVQPMPPAPPVEVAPSSSDTPPVVRVEDMPLSPAPKASPAPPRRRAVPRAPHPKRDVWSAFSEHR